VVTAFGICNQRFEPINTDAIALADTVTVPWFMPGSAELAEAVGEALRRSRGAILQNHGLMAVGDDLRKAATRAAMLEETAKLQLYIKQFGGTVSLLPDEWVKKLGPIKDFL
jgi:ribulose-5-phosphate 4-epimerase/fuculose-1-phosphate aldolase